MSVDFVLCGRQNWKSNFRDVQILNLYRFRPLVKDFVCGSISVFTKKICVQLRNVIGSTGIVSEFNRK